MATKTEFVSEMEAHLKELSAKLGKLRAKFEESHPDERSIFEDDIERLQQKYGVAAQKIEELRKAEEHEWEDLKKGSRELVHDLQETLNHAFENI
jgi:hypothetical protein